MSTTTLAAIKSGAVAEPVKADPVMTAITQAVGKLGSLLPKHITAERMGRLVLNELRLQPKLMEAAQASPHSLASAMMTASSLGLEIGGAKGHGYLVPFWNPDTKRKEIQFMPGYRGLLELARQSGDVKSISVQVVHEHDEFEMVLGIEETLRHKPKLQGDRGAIGLVYAIAHFKDGTHHFDWMSVTDVERIRLMSKRAESGPWKEHYEEMARKTMIRRIVKYLPMSSEKLEQAIQVSDAVDQGMPTDDGVIEMQGSEAAQPPATPESTGSAEKSQPAADPVPDGDARGGWSVEGWQVRGALNSARQVKVLNKHREAIPMVDSEDEREELELLYQRRLKEME